MCLILVRRSGARERRLIRAPEPLSTALPISVEEFLRFKCKAVPDRCMGYVGLHKDVLGQQLSALSGGQLQRILIAWAIIDNSDILLMDEPTSGVDIGSEEPIYKKVTQLKKSMGMTVLLISHNLHVVMHYSDNLLALNRRQTFYGPTYGLSSSRILGPDVREHIRNKGSGEALPRACSGEIMADLYLALIVGAFVGTAAGYPGSIMVSRCMALIGDTLFHVALPGLAISLTLNFNPFIGAFAFLAVAAVLTWHIRRRTTFPMEAIIGVIFVLALAIRILITPGRPPRCPFRRYLNGNYDLTFS